MLDVNDNPPKFKHSVIRATFNKSAEQFDSVQIMATDADYGKNARIGYSILDTDYFRIDPDTGVLAMLENVSNSY